MMEIPDDLHMVAYKAAAAVQFVNGKGEEVLGGIPHSAHIAAAVEAVAPFIAAQAWGEGRDAALDAFDSDGYYEGTTNPYREEV